jgi:hypothetical protein
MKTIVSFLLAICAALILVGCGRGSSAPAPTDVTLVPGDGTITVSWTMEPGVEYWLFSAVANSISTDNWITLPAARAATAVSSPYVLKGLVNGATYSITINGRVNGGPGGAGSPSRSAIPRLAGDIWNAGAAASANDLRGIGYGTAFFAVGTNGATLTSGDGKAWMIQNSGVATTLNAAAYGGNYLAAGAGGTILFSSDAVTWSSQASGTGNDLFGLSANGSFYLTVGANGAIITSSGGTNWVARTSGTANALYSVTYGNGRYVAVGASGTILTSTDAITWQTIAPLTSNDLKGVAYGAYGAGVFVAMGTAGTLLTSPDGVTWTLQPPIASNPNINAVGYSTQFAAVGDGGVILISTNGTSWKDASVTPVTANNLYAIASGNHGYVSVGSSGANLTAY